MIGLDFEFRPKIQKNTMINSSSEKFVKKGRLFASLFSCEEYAEHRCNASSQLFSCEDAKFLRRGEDML